MSKLENIIKWIKTNPEAFQAALIVALNLYQILAVYLLPVIRLSPPAIPYFVGLFLNVILAILIGWKQITSVKQTG